VRRHALEFSPARFEFDTQLTVQSAGQDERPRKTCRSGKGRP
jgi:hypothetical protein